MQPRRRFNPLIIVGIICLLIIVPLFLIGKRGPENAASDFMIALGKGDVPKLAELSVIGNHNLEERTKLWQDSVNYSKYYVFTWRITDVSQIDDSRAAVILQMRRNLQMRMGEDEAKFELPLVQSEGSWKVSVDQMDRDIYPYLPRS